MQIVPEPIAVFVGMAGPSIVLLELYFILRFCEHGLDGPSENVSSWGCGIKRKIVCLELLQTSLQITKSQKSVAGRLMLFLLKLRVMLSDTVG